MAEKKEYRSSIRSRKLIRKAFLELLQEKEFQKITVTDVVKRADLNRSTFYAHYPDIRGVVEELQNEVFQHNSMQIENIDVRSFAQNPIPYLQEISHLLGENVELFKRLGHTEELHVRLDELRRIIVEQLRTNENIPQQIRQSPSFFVRIHFFAGGMMNTYQQWAEGYLDCSLEEITAEIGNLIVLSCKDLLLET